MLLASIVVQLLQLVWVSADDSVCLIWEKSGHVALNVSMFNRRSCSECFWNLYTYQAIKGLLNEKLYVNNSTWMFEFENGTSFEPDTSLGSTAYLSFHGEEKPLQSWIQCCEAAKNCCQKMSKKRTASPSDSGLTCPAMWDGFHCLEDTPGDVRFRMDCTDYYFVYAVEPRSPCPRSMAKYCNPTTGHWVFNKWDCLPREFHRKSGLPNPENETEVCCRTERGIELSLSAYKLDTCARCYKYLPSALLAIKLIYYEECGCLGYNETVHYAIPDRNQSAIIYESLEHLDYLKRNWENCCEQARKCCSIIGSTVSRAPTTGSFCPKTWDGWSCFENDVPAGSVAKVLCPPHAYNYNSQSRKECTSYAERKCHQNATWKIDDRNPYVEYTEYKTCNRLDDKKHEYQFNIAVCVLSMLAILPALIIFHSYSQLKVNRIKMHVHFFIALFLNCLMIAINKGTLFMDIINKKSVLMEENGPFCKILLILTRYFRMTSYAWMVCEGFYLHRQIAAAFTEQRKFLPFVIAGWGFPLLPTIIYAILRKTQDDTLCWIVPHNKYDWIFNSFNLFFLILNLIFLSHIIYILITKLRSVQSNEQNSYRKAVRAAVMLIPLFGIHYFLISYNPENTSCQIVTIYNYFQITIDGLQGLAVSVLFCYTNSEVITLVKRSWSRYKTDKGLNQRTIRSRFSLSTQVSTVNENTLQQRRNTTSSRQIPTTEL